MISLRYTFLPQYNLREIIYLAIIARKQKKYMFSLRYTSKESKMAILRVILGKGGRPITAEQRDEMEQAAREYDQKVRDAIAKDERLKKMKPPKKKGRRSGTMHGRYLKALYGK